MEILIGRWDCNTCGHVGNLGPNTKCSQCGAPRPQDVIFYLPENAELVQDEKGIEDALAGADWICAHCTAHNTAKDSTCHACGSAREDADGDKQIEEIDYGEGNAPSTGQRPQRPNYPEDITKASKNPFKKWLIGILVSLFGVGGLYSLDNAFQGSFEAEVVSLPWSRVIETERYREVEEEDWQVPAEGRKTASFSAIHHYNKVFRGYETRTRYVRKQVGTESYTVTKSMGNGRFRKDRRTRPRYENVPETYQEAVYDNVPEYRTKYKYLIFRWKPDAPLTTQGTTQPAYWYKEAESLVKQDFRLAERKEKYEVVFKDHEGEQRTEEVKAAFWEKIGKKIPIRYTRFLRRYKGLVEDK